ncbi:MAG: hypothetical protein M3N28_04630 [Actinomycetota bacterium]|nr:hypothetical protein [Actinomycetota bacterium]
MSNATNAPVDGAALNDPGEFVVAIDTGSRARRIAFRVLAVITTLWMLALSVFGLLELVLMWLPGETLMSMIDDFTATDLSHRSHFMSVGIVAWATVLAIVVQLRKPARRVAPMLQLVVIAIAAAVVFALSGTFGDWLLAEATILVPVLLLTWLHPRARDLVSKPTFDRAMFALTAVAAVPWSVFIVNHARLQLASAAGDSHAELEHWANAALMAIVILACGFIGSSDHDGWRLPAWIAAGASLVYGVHSLVFPDPSSAASTVWAVAAVAWGLVFGVSIVRRSRAGQHAVTP